MIESSLKYSKGFKYQVNREIWFKTKITGHSASWKWLSLTSDGWLYIQSGYCWDGASGPTIDSKSSMRGSLVHDALYQLMRREKIPRDEKTRQKVDEELRTWCMKDGMLKCIARVWFWAVQKFAKSASHPDNKRKTYTVP